MTESTAVNEAGNRMRVRGQLQPFEVTTWVDHGRAMADVEGELDVYTARDLDDALRAVQARAASPVLVLMLTGLTFADSSALGMLIAAAKRAQARGGAVALVEVPEQFAKVLSVTGLTGLLPGFATLKDAGLYLDGIAS